MQSERRDWVTRAHHVEVSPVQSRYVVDAESLGYGDNESINGSQRQVIVLADQLCHATQIVARGWFDTELLRHIVCARCRER